MARPPNPPKPRGFPDVTTAADLRDLLADRGRHCEGERMDYQDAKDAIGWAPAETPFRLMRVDPKLSTPCVLDARRFKRWPIIVGFNDRHEGDGAANGIVDGLHRCAVANYRGYSSLWAYVPVQADGRPFTLTTWMADAALRDESG